MNVCVKAFNSLSADELHEILRVRAVVFQMEQGIHYTDPDSTDRRSLHLFRREGEEIVSYARLFPAASGCAHLGRVLTMQRGKGLGREIVEAALCAARQMLHAACVRIDAQSYIAPFYEHLGFRPISGEYVLESIPHIKMEKPLQPMAEESHATADPHHPPAYTDIWMRHNAQSPFPYSYKYPRAAVTADCCLFCQKDGKAHVLLIRRGAEPYKGCWAFPGGFLDTGIEDTEQCARRELTEETGLTAGDLQLVGVFSRPERDPRCPVVTASYCGIIPYAEATGCDDAAEARWFPLDSVPPLAFDHDKMLAQARAILFP